MAITINIYYTGKNGNARKFAEEMVSSGIVIDMHHASPMMAQIIKLREKYDLHMKEERYISDEEGIPLAEKNLLRIRYRKKYDTV